jgi:hypothetical protein
VLEVVAQQPSIKEFFWNLDRYDDNTFLSLLLTGESPANIPRQPGSGDQSVDSLLKQIDRNGDGKLGRDEAGPQLKRWFDRLDQDGDGTLDRQELRPLVERRSGTQ